MLEQVFVAIRKQTGIAFNVPTKANEEPVNIITICLS